MLSRATLAVATACTVSVAIGVVDAGTNIPELATVRVTGGLQFPVFATHAPGDTSRLFILEKPGRIRILNLDTGVLLGTAFLDINGIVGGGNGLNDETGLLGLAFHPDYQNNGFFYVYYTNNGLDTEVARYKVSANPDLANPARDAWVFGGGLPPGGDAIFQPQPNHNAGWIGFSPNDGYLYIALGDGGNFCDTGAGHSNGGNAQDLTNNLLGKMLRIDINGDDFPASTKNYAIPPDNPFVGINGDDEIWAYGLRNPYRASFDRDTGDLYIGDVGQDAREEVDYQPASSTGGENYGWRCMEGNVCSSASGCSTTGCTCGSPALTLPIHHYSHNPPPPPTGFVCAVTGGYAYRGCAIPGLAGHYFFADFCGNAVWSFLVSGGVATQFTNRTPEITPSLGGFVVNQIVSFGEDANGEMYIVDQGFGGTSGQVFKIVSECPADINGDGAINVLDLIELLLNFGVAGCAPTDVNGDGATNVLDLVELLLEFGTSCP